MKKKKDPEFLSLAESQCSCFKYGCAYARLLVLDPNTAQHLLL